MYISVGYTPRMGIAGYSGRIVTPPPKSLYVPSSGMLNCMAKETDMGGGIKFPLWPTPGKRSELFGGRTIITVILRRVEETQKIGVVALGDGHG